MSSTRTCLPSTVRPSSSLSYATWSGLMSSLCENIGQVETSVREHQNTLLGLVVSPTRAPSPRCLGASMISRIILTVQLVCRFQLSYLLLDRRVDSILQRSRRFDWCFARYIHMHVRRFPSLSAPPSAPSLPSRSPVLSPPPDDARVRDRPHSGRSLTLAQPDGNIHVDLG